MREKSWDLSWKLKNFNRQRPKARAYMPTLEGVTDQLPSNLTDLVSALS